MKTYQHKATGNKDLFRVVDRNEDWNFYFHKPSNSYFPAVNYILHRGYAAPELIEWAKNHSKEEIDAILEKTSDRGDAVHQAINKVLEIKKADRSLKVLAEDNRTERTLTNDEWDYLLTFVEFWNRHDCELVSKEQSVFSNFGYSGTYDIICILKKNCGVKTCKCDEFIGKKGLLDWKTSSGIYQSYGAQVSAYANAHGVKADYTGIVRLGTRHTTTGGYEFKPFNQLETSANFDRFIAAMKIAQIPPFNPEEIYEVPDSFELNPKTETPTAEKTEEKVKRPRKLNPKIKAKIKKHG